MQPPLPLPFAFCEHGLPLQECAACARREAEADATADPNEWATDPDRATVPTDIALDPVGVPYH